MLSLRAIARSAPRSISRLALSTTPRAAFLPRLAPITSTLIPRSFSTSPFRLDAASQELSALLVKELQFAHDETETDAESDSQIKMFLAENAQWKVQDTPGEHEVLLERKYDDETITVAFSILDYNNPMMDGEEGDEALMDEEDADLEGQSGGALSKGAGGQGRTRDGNVKMSQDVDEDSEIDAGDAEPAFPANVSVLVQRAAKGALRFNLLAENGIWTISACTHIGDSKHTKSLTPSQLLRLDSTDPANAPLYEGPPYVQLDEGVQSVLETYLDVRGINTALALFVPEYIDVKEAKEYAGWLQRVKSFVD